MYKVFNEKGRKRVANLNVRVTEEFETDIVERAEKQGLDKSEYIRRELSTDKNEIIKDLSDTIKKKEKEIEDLKNNHQEESDKKEREFSLIINQKEQSIITSHKAELEQINEQHQKELSKKDNESKKQNEQIEKYQQEILKMSEQSKKELQEERERIEKNYHNLLDKKDEQIEKLTQLLDQEQQLQLVTQSKNEQLQIELENFESKKWWQFWR